MTILARPGAAVAFWREGGVAFGIVAAEEGRRVRVVLRSGRIERIQAARIIVEVTAPGAVPNRGVASEREAGERAAAIAARVRDRASCVEVPLLWEVVCDEGVEKGSFAVSDLAELGLGSSTGDDRAAVVLALISEGLHFVRKGEDWEPRSAEAVQKLLVERERRITREAEKRDLLEALGALRGGSGWQGSGSATEQRTLDALEQLVFHEDGAADSARKLAVEALAAFGAKFDRPAEGAFRLLRRTGRFDSDDENIQRIKYGLREDFPQDVLAASAEIVNRGFSRDGRCDRTASVAISIDSPETREIDDLISVEFRGDGFSLAVHIADPGAFVRPDDPVDREALSRGLTRYMPDLKVLMMPPALSECSGSLVAGADRPALSFLVELDGDGEVESFRIERTVVRSAGRVDYAEVDCRLAAEEGEHLELLRRLDRCAAARLEARLRRGAIVIDAPELSVRVDEDGSPSYERIPTGSRSRRIVTEAMVLVGEVAARFCREHGLAVVYRRQAPPSRPIADSGKAIVDALEVRAARKSLRRAEGGLDPGEHAALALPAYVQVTSPLRRFQDLVVSRQINAVLCGDPPFYDRAAIQRIGATTEQAEGEARRAERAARNYWILRCLEAFVGQTVDALVVADGPRPVVQLVETLWEQPIPSLVGAEAGSRVLVRVVRVNPRAGLLVLEPEARAGSQASEVP